MDNVRNVTRSVFRIDHDKLKAVVSLGVLSVIQ